MANSLNSKRSSEPNHHDAVLVNLREKQKSLSMASASAASSDNIDSYLNVTPLELKNNVTEKEQNSLSPECSGGYEKTAASSALDTIDGRRIYNLTGQQHSELNAIFQRMGQPSPSVVLDIAFKLNVSPVAAEKFFRNAKRQKPAVKHHHTPNRCDTEVIALDESPSLSDLVSPESSRGVSNRVSSSSCLIDKSSGAQKLSSVRRRWNAIRNVVFDARFREISNRETLKREAKKKCSALSRCAQDCCWCCREICGCSCLMCCIFCCCCCKHCFTAFIPNTSFSC